MGSSCSSRQSGKDSASIRSDESANEGAAPSPTTARRSEEEKSFVEDSKGRAKDKSALKLIESDFSSCGEEGATVGTPISSSVSACAANGSTKGKPPEKDERKGVDELPDLSFLKEEARALLEGRTLTEVFRKGRKVCVVVLGSFDEGGNGTLEMLTKVQSETSARLNAEGAEVVIIAPRLNASLHSVDPAELLARYVQEESDLCTVLVFLLRGSSPETFELPAAVAEESFLALCDALGDDEEKVLLKKWYPEGNGSIRKLQRPHNIFHGLVSEDSFEFGRCYDEWRREHEKVLSILTKVGSEESLAFSLKPAIEKDLECLKDLPSRVPLKVVLVRKDARKSPTEDKVEQLLQNLSSFERVQEMAKQMFQESRSGWDVVRPLLSGSEGSEEWWRNVTAKMAALVLDSISASTSFLKSKSCNPMEGGIPAKVLNEICCHHNYTKANSQSQPKGLAEYLIQIKKYLTSPSKTALLIEGATGSGKTRLLMQSSLECSKWIPNACVATRYVQLTDNSTTAEGLLYYLAEQHLLTHGHPSSYVSSDIPGKLQKVWQRATSSRPLVVFLDGVEHLSGGDKGHSCLLDVVCALPEHVWVVLSAHQDSRLREHFSNRVHDQDCFIKIQNSDEEISENLLKDFMLNSKEFVAKSTWIAAQKSCQSHAAPLYLLILSQLFFIGAKEDENFGSNLEEIIEYFFKQLHNIFPSVFLESVLGCLSLSRLGLLESEILALIKAVQRRPSENSILDWVFLRRLLSPLLIMRRANGLVLISFKRSIRHLVKAAVLGTEEKINKSLEIFREKVFINEENKILNVNLPEEEKGCLSYLRSLQDSVLSLEKKRETNILFNLDWLFKMVETSGPFNVLEEIDLALEENSAQSLELSILREVLKFSSPSLMYDSSQFLSQIYGRLKWRLSKEENCARLSTLLTNAFESPLPCLLPLSSCLAGVRQDNSSSKDEEKTTYINSIFRIPGNPHHVIAISTKRSRLTVWNVFSMEVVRTLIGINQPRKLEMIDDYKCLLLCGRELGIYNLNEGTFLMKLREVMNQKMPFFGLHDSDHVVALSRSRMYVNMMNLTEGNCVTTFKVGEDRFLNSLLVSENGKICVCGDDSQKPSALLVWDLQLRKLMYDLRIPHHEFSTLLAAITLEGLYVCCVCREVDEPAPNFIVVYDLQSGTLFKRWKPEVNTISISISTAGTCVIVGLEDSSIMAFDLITGNRRWTVFGHCSPPDTFRLDKTGLVLLSYDSQGKDRSLRVWDVRTGKNLATFTPDQRITACEITCDGKVVVLSLEGHDTIFTFLLMHREHHGLTESSLPYGDEEYKGKVADFSLT